MNIDLHVNGKPLTLQVSPKTTLLDALRKAGFYSVKRGCDTGECGSCAVLIDGKLVNTCHILAVQAEGKCIHTAEGLGTQPAQGWKETPGLSILQQSFIDVGAIQCGYCTPAMLLAAKDLLDKKGYGTAATPEPVTDAEIREAISGVLCRCTGYVKPVEAILRAAARLRGEEVPPIGENGIAVDLSMGPSASSDDFSNPEVTGIGPSTLTRTLPARVSVAEAQPHRAIGKPQTKLDANKLAQGKPAFTDDFEIRGMLIGKVLRSPVAHARIAKIDVSKAQALPGVAAVLTYKDLPRVPFSSAGQSDPLPAPMDTFSLDSKVRFVGDRVAFVAAETEEIAEQALKLIDVTYEELPAVIDPRQAMASGAPILHDEPDYVPFDLSDPSKNVAARIEVNIGNVDQGFAEADEILESDYIVPKVQQASLEPHIVITYFDEDDRLVVRTATQVPFHVRRILAPILKLPVQRIRVIKPRIGGGFGGKQEMVTEDVAAHLTIATGRPVKYECTRQEELIASRSRHPMRVHMKTGYTRDGSITANEMYILSDTGAYGSHAQPVAGNCGSKSMALYVGDGKYREHPNIRFSGDVVYTNTVPAGAFRGYGAPQGFFPVEVQMDRIAARLGIDPIEFRLKNSVRQNEIQPFSTAWSEGRKPMPEYILTCALDVCAQNGAAAIDWYDKKNNPAWKQVPGKPNLRRGVGVAMAMQGSGIAHLDMGGASLKINDDGSFNLLVGATDLGTGSDTILAQMAAELLGCSATDIVVYSSDTDMTPFDTGAYASSTTYISGGAVVRAAEQVADQIRKVAAEMLGGDLDPDDLDLHDKQVWASDGRSVTFAQVALNSLHHNNQHQIMAVASMNTPVSPAPFTAQFAEVTVDMETGEARIQQFVTAIDSGVIINPVTASGQIEGAVEQSLGYALCEEMPYSEQGQPLAKDLRDYHIFTAEEMPEVKTIFVETYEPSHPLGVKAVSELPMNGVAPAVVNAIHDATGVWVTEIPATPERIWRAMQAK